MGHRLRLAVGVPWISEFIWTRSVLSMLKQRPPDDCEVDFFFAQNDGWCAARRHNSVLEQAKLWGADLICILGADQIYPPDMLQKLVKRHREGCDVVAAMVPIRGHVAGQGTKPFQPIVWRYKADENGNIVTGDRGRMEFITPEHGDLVQINGCGSGVLMFPTSALDHLHPPWFYETPVGPTFERKACADWPFVGRLQRDAELKVWCDTTIRVKHIQPFEIDDTFTDRFPDWEQNGDTQIIENHSEASQILQVRVSPSLPFYDAKFRARYKLQKYATAFFPSFFFGCYTKEDLDAVLKHESLAVLIWAGTDALNMRKALEAGGKHPFPPNVRHVAISKFIADDLDALGIPFTRLPLCNVDEAKFKPVPRGKAVYVYLPDHDREKYGGEMVGAVRAALPDVEFVIQSKLDPSADMPGLYARCGVGLRLLEHDGLSNTVVELGLAGRRCIWNGDTPNALPYKTVDDVVRRVRQELERPDDTEEVAAAMAEYITLPQQWKTVEFYNRPAGIVPPEVANKPYEYDSYFDARYRAGARGAGGPDPESNEAKWTQEVVAGFITEAGCESVVEVGCGAAVRWDSLPCNNYTGIDVSAEALKHAARKFPDATWLLRDITKEWHIPYGDAVVALDILQHIKPKDYKNVLDNLFAHANKILIIKTSVGIPELKYQFDHGAPPAAEGWECRMIKVPDSAPSFLFIFQKQLQEAAV